MDTNAIALVVISLLFALLLIVFIREIRKARREQKNKWLDNRIAGKPEPRPPRPRPVSKPRKAKYKPHRR